MSYVFLLLCMFCSVYSVFIVPTGTLRLPWLRVFRAFSSDVGKCQGITRKDGARSALFLISELCCSMSIELLHVLFVCKCALLPPGVNPIAVKCIILYHIISYQRRDTSKYYGSFWTNAQIKKIYKFFVNNTWCKCIILILCDPWFCLEGLKNPRKCDSLNCRDWL